MAGYCRTAGQGLFDCLKHPSELSVYLSQGPRNLTTPEIKSLQYFEAHPLQFSILTCMVPKFFHVSELKAAPWRKTTGTP